MATDMQNAKKEKKKRNKSTYTTSGKKIRSFISVSRESLKNKKIRDMST
jgi:hypothetical protein